MPREISPSEEAQLTAGPLLPTIAGVVYGAWRVFKSNWQEVHAGTAWFLVIAGIVTLVLIPVYTGIVLSPPGRSWKGTFGAAGAFAIIIYACFEIVALGVFGVWYAIEHHLGFWHMAFAAFWVPLGIHMLKKLADIQRIGKRLQTEAASSSSDV